MKRRGHIKVEYGAGDVVSIALPTWSVKVTREDAEGIRDYLNAVLPVKDIDLEVLRAARTMLADRGQDTENLAVAIAHIEATRNPQSCTLCNCDSVGELYGFPVCTYHTDHTEDDAPCPRCHGRPEYWGDANGNHWCDDCMTQHDEADNTDATQGLTRRAPQPGAEWWCHACSARLPATAGAEPDEPARQLVAVGDRVRDALDGGRWREIVRIDLEGTCHMRDGGCMSVAECAAAEKRLPSENLPSMECGATGRTRRMHS